MLLIAYNTFYFAIQILSTGNLVGATKGVFGKSLYFLEGH